MLSVKAIRKDFPIFKRTILGRPLVYLDNAATSQRPKQVIAAVNDFYRRHNANVHRGIHTLSEEASNLYEEARATVAGFINCGSDELIFVRNTTEGINLVVWTWGFDHVRSGDEILVTVMEHHSNFVPWQQMAVRRGAVLRVADITEDGLLDMEDFKKKLSKKTKIVAVTHCSNVTGTINPVSEIVRLAKRVGAVVLIDGAQGVQHIGIDVKVVGCDFLAFSGHKMLGPMGSGGLFIKRERQEEMGPFLTGGGMIREVYATHFVWAEGPEKFEAGTPDVAGAVGLAEAVRYHTRLGMRYIRKHESNITAYALERLRDMKDMQIFGPSDVKVRGGVVSFTIKGIHPHDVAEVLNYRGVAVRSGTHCAMPLHDRFRVPATTRASFYLYNDKKDIDALISGLEQAKHIFR
ncbi:SufS family cysteine desulfurase [Patescibacteria group bacterium]|nr:SufS family cysteine desulfurase [Patescibacteria group bacterium]MBU1472226.1 SufS family cysteine desulfurase [Patescibacteria group bacterium]MBU2460522.1 SufS family cysteine desulfurase [Patescibacteria group bacterium]